MLYDKKWDKEIPINTDGFKTATELGLRNREYTALVKTLELFEQGKVPKHLFNMRTLGQPECGSAGCLLGWARSIDDRCFYSSWPLGSSWPLVGCPIAPIEDLFSARHGNATPTEGAIALRNYLTTGDPKWEQVLNRKYPTYNKS